jgi:hypothetical protein
MAVAAAPLLLSKLGPCTPAPPTSDLHRSARRAGRAGPRARRIPCGRPASRPPRPRTWPRARWLHTAPHPGAARRNSDRSADPHPPVSARIPSIFLDTTSCTTAASRATSVP